MSGYLGLALDVDDVPSSGRCLRCSRNMNCLKPYRAHAILIVLLYTQVCTICYRPIHSANFVVVVRHFTKLRYCYSDVFLL